MLFFTTMIEQGNKNARGFHLAGIIPISGMDLDFGFPWPDCMQPISKNYLAIERAVVECAYAGCETIWLVCNDDIQPIIKHRLGDFIQDPYHLHATNFVKHPSEYRKQIPIFYIPVHPKDRDKRDSYGWNIMHGILRAFSVSHKMSKCVIPGRYYIAFPYGIYDPKIVYSHRKRISSPSSFGLTFEGESIKTGAYMGFTLDASEFKQCLYETKKACSGASKNLPIEERWSSRNFGLDKIFKCVNIEKENIVELKWHYNIDSWESLLKYLKSDHVLDRPPQSFFKVEKLKPLEI